MPRRYFDHLYAEICVALGRRVSRYAVWLMVWEAGGDPDDLTAHQARTFVEEHLDALLREEGAALAPQARRRLERSILEFAPDHPTPEEWMTRLGQAADSVHQAVFQRTLSAPDPTLGNDLDLLAGDGVGVASALEMLQ